MAAPRQLGIAVAALSLALSAAADDYELLPDLSLRLMAARYAPSEQDFGWVGWLGGSAGVVRAGRMTLFGSADVETVIGSERRDFDANQANYHLGFGVKHSWPARELALYFDHVSRHRVDRAKPEAVDWNSLGLRFWGRLSKSPPARFEVSAGHTTLASTVGYEFEGTVALAADLVSRERWAVFVNAGARGVTVDEGAAFARGDFVDVWLEGGVRFRRGQRALELFAAYEHRNDVYVTLPGVRDRALFGVRFALADGSTTDAPPAPGRNGPASSDPRPWGSPR